MPRQAPSPLKTQREHRKIAPHPDDSRELDVLSIALSKCRVSEFLWFYHRTLIFKQIPLQMISTRKQLRLHLYANRSPRDTGVRATRVGALAAKSPRSAAHSEHGVDSHAGSARHMNHPVKCTADIPFCILQLYS